MAGPPSQAFSQLTVRYSGPGLPFPAVTTHGFTTSAEPLADVVEAIADFGRDLAAAISGFLQVDDVLWKVGPVDIGQTITVPVNQVGGIAGGVAPANVAALVSVQALNVSGRFHGRFFLPGVLEFGVDDSSNLTNTHRETIQTAVDTAYADVAAVGMSPRVFSTSSSDPRSVESISVQRRVSTQRRRMRR